jgi:zinc protease
MNARTRWSAVVALVLASAVAALVGQAPPAQPPPPSAAIVVKGRAPVSDRILQVKLPRPMEADLPNGIHVMVLEDRRAPQMAVNFIVRGAGGFFDPADHIGLAQFTAMMLREGTTTRTSQQIAEQLERMAATLGASAGMASEDATISAGALTEYIDPVLDLAADVVLNPSFPDAELARFKARTRATLMQQRSMPALLAQERFMAVLAGDHPAGRVLPAVASLDRTTRESLAAFHKARYVPDHVIVAIAGDISMADAMKKIQARFGAWPKAGVAAPASTDPPAVTAPGVYLVARPNSVQTNLVVGVQAIKRTDPDYFTLTVLNKIIGGGPTGRLFRHLREEKGYTYGAYSNLSAPAYRGLWVANTDVRTEVTEAALTDLIEELRQVRDVTVPQKEFDDARRSLVAAFALDLENPMTAVGNAVTRYRYGLPADYWDRYPSRIMAVTPADVQAAAKRYLDPGRVQIVAVGNGDAIAPGLKKFGTVQVFDTEGKKIGEK